MCQSQSLRLLKKFWIDSSRSLLHLDVSFIRRHRSDLSEKAAMPVKRYDRGCFSAFKLVDASFAALLRSLVFDDVECWSSGLHHCFSVDVTTTATH